MSFSVNISAVVRGEAVLDAEANRMVPRRVMRIARDATVVLDGLVITGGWAPLTEVPMYGSYKEGGGILNEGNLSMIHCMVTGNHAVESGGAIYNILGTVRLISTTIANNTASAVGAALYNAQHGWMFNASDPFYARLFSTFVIINSTISNNRVLADNHTKFTWLYGGGMRNIGTTFIYNSIIANNSGGGGGGGIHNFHGNLTAYDSVIDGNLALLGHGEGFGSGGGLLLDHGSVELFNTTICNNVATFRGGGVYVVAGVLILGNNARLVANVAGEKSSANAYSQQVLRMMYVLPPPTGFYVSPVFDCKEMVGCTDIHGSHVQCHQVCNFSRYRDQKLANLSVSIGEEGYPYACALGSFGNQHTASSSRQSQATACTVCPFNTTTVASGSTSSTACVCSAGFFHDLGTNATDNATGARLCVSCTTGFHCTSNDTRPLLGLDTTSVNVSQGYWRPTSAALMSKPCPHRKLCLGGVSSSSVQLDTRATCAQDFHGAYCTQCVNTSHYLDTWHLICHPCSNVLSILGLICGSFMGIVLVVVCIVSLVVSGPAIHAPSLIQRLCHRVLAIPSTARRIILTCANRMWNHSSFACLRATSDSIDLPVKGKLLLGFAMVVAQIGDVYRVRYPRDYESITNLLFAPLRLQLFGWIPGLHLHCFGITALEAELLLYSLAPLVLVLIGFAMSWLYHRSLVPALPFVLRLTYVFYPSVSSKGFQTLGECDCFEQIDGYNHCFLPADFAVECPGHHAPPRLLLLGGLAVGLFGVCVPLLYASLLFWCRSAIRENTEFPLAAALAFLHGSLYPWALFWPLIEALRALLLTGVFALIAPGHIFQLLCGLVASFAFTCLQIWVAPYRTVSNNFLATLINVSLFMDFVSSIGVKVNSEYGGDIQPLSLSVLLYTSAFAVFLLTLLSLLLALRQRVMPAQLRAYLLNEDGASMSPDEQPLPLVARFGEYSINASDVQQAIDAPLLTMEEVETLRSTSLRAAEAATPTSGKYAANAADLLLSEPTDAARGVASQLGVPYLELLGRMARGVRTIEDEFEAHGTEEDRRCLHYVLHEEAGAHEEMQEPGRGGKRLAYFVQHPNARVAGLEEVHVVALRVYTSQAYASLNTPLRSGDGGSKHPFAATVAFIAEGIKRLRAVHEGGHTSRRLWRGLRNIHGTSLARTGGTERAVLSCTPHLETAARFATSREAFLFLITVKSFMQGGASLEFLSCMPHEREVCYPPCTYLKPTGRLQRLELPGKLQCVVAEVTPHVGS